MTTKQPPGLFITGTDTGVGKTYVTARIAAAVAGSGRRVGVYKPAASGCHESERTGKLVCEDADALWEGAGRPGELSRVCPQRFRAPLAAHLAAQAEGKQIDERLLRDGLAYWRDCSDLVLVEGAGGLMSPISQDEYVADLAFEFGYPLIVVAPNLLGVINQTLQTLITAATFRDGLAVAGVVLNHVSPPSSADDPSVSSNRSELEQRCVPPVLAELGWQQSEFTQPVDWFRLATGER